MTWEVSLWNNVPVVLYRVEVSGRGIFMEGTRRENIKPGVMVKVVQKSDQRTGRLTEGVVKDVLTKSLVHPRGIKVRLESGIIGRVHELVDRV